MQDNFIIGQIGHATAALTFAWLVFASYRYVRRRSTALGAIFATTILVRVAMGSAAFWISYLELPIARSFQLGGGFWRLFLDATGNYQSAALAASEYQLFGLEHAVAAPFFVNVLAVWMMAVGTSPASAVFLNLCLYALLVTLLVKFFAPVNDWRRDLPCLISVGGYSFSPAVLIHSTQPMKEELACVLVGILCFGALTVTQLLREHRITARGQALLIAAGSVVLAIFGMSGVRWYFGFAMWCALALALTIFALREKTTTLPRYLTGSIGVLLAAWVAFWIGTGPYYRQFGPDLQSSNLSVTSVVDQIAAVPSYLALRVRLARAGFLTSGGGTNLVIPLRGDAGPGEARLKELREAEHASYAYQRNAAAQARALVRLEEAETRLGPRNLASEESVASRAFVTTAPSLPPRAIDQPPENFGLGLPINASEDVQAAAWGLAVFFVPISLVENMAGLNIGGGRGLLRVTDIDTVLMDIAIVSVFALLWTRRRAIGSRLPLVVFSAILFGVGVILLAYSVTNFGTLWRIRPMTVVPLWALATALSPRPETPGDPAAIPRRP